MGISLIHYEGSLLKFWENLYLQTEQGVSFSTVTPEQKEAAKDGLLVYKNSKFMPQ